MIKFKNKWKFWINLRIFLLRLYKLSIDGQIYECILKFIIYWLNEIKEFWKYWYYWKSIKEKIIKFKKYLRRF